MKLLGFLKRKPSSSGKKTPGYNGTIFWWETVIKISK